jgi:hypothetical protein
MKKTTITGFRTRYHNVIIKSGKGGVHKTGATTHVSSAALMLGARLHLFEIDKQKLLAKLFGALCTTVQLSGAAELASKSAAHLTQLNGLFEAMTADNEDLVICDIGAGFEGLVFEAMLAGGVGPLLAGGSRKTAVIIPFDTSDESLESAVVASQRSELVLPEAALIFCAPDPGFTPNTARSRQLWKDHIAPAVEKNGLMVFPALGADVYDIFTAAGVAPHRFAELDPVELARRTGQLQFVARSSILQLSALTAHVAREGERLLGFRQSEDASA